MKRGIIIYIAEHLNAAQTSIDCSSFKECIFYDIISTNQRDHITVGCIYRSPDSDEENNNKLLDLLKEADKKNPNRLYILGDFNIKEINWRNNIVHSHNNSYAYKMYDTINQLFLTEIIQEPTRIRVNQNSSTLDWILTHNEDDIYNMEIGSPLGKSDHAVITFNINNVSDIQEQKRKYNYYKGDYMSINNKIKNTNWIETFHNKNIEDSWNLFATIILDMVEIHIPKCSKNTNKQPPWLNKTTKDTIKNKHRAWNKYKKNKNVANWGNYVICRNLATKSISRARKSYEEKITAEINTNPKSFWKYVGGRKKMKIMQLVSEDKQMVTDDKNKAKLLNHYFSSVFTKEDEHEYPDIKLIGLEEGNTSSLDVIKITEKKVLKELLNLNIAKSAGPDGIHPKVLRETATQIVIPLTIIFKKSLSEGALPHKWKIAHVIPIFKKGNKSTPSNYRPVSLTAICCKILERIIKQEIVNHLENNNILNKNQHGFRNRRSCITQLLEVIDIWNNIYDQGIPWDTIYMDFAKAFDKVPHKRLIHKIKGIGIQGTVLTWIINFLNKRQQRVILNNDTSDWADVISGIPQGSVLGPILFIIFINDLPKEVKSYIKIFADDTKLFRAIKNIKDIDGIQQDITKLTEWSIRWQLMFNDGKCKVVHYGKNNPRYQYMIKGEPLNTDTEETDLGITFEEGFNFSKHIAKIAAKANSRLGLIKRTFKIRTEKIIIILYKSLVRPILEYGSVIWSPYTKQDKDVLETIQRRATKMITRLRDLSYPNRLKTLKLPSLTYRRIRVDILQLYRILKGIDNINPRELFELDTNELTRGHSLRIKKTRCLTSKKLHSFPHRAINIWNKLDNNTVTCQTINSFKTALQKEWNRASIKYDPNGNMHA